MSEMLWKPSEASIQKTQMMNFMGYVNNHYGLSINDYESLYQWSIDYSDDFWAAVWHFNKVIHSIKWDQVLDDKDKMPGAKWFVGARLNFAENLLRHYKLDKDAIVFCNERGERRTLSYAELYKEVAKFAYALTESGIKEGDRVAAVMPNMPETIIAMLATTSIGAIFSSCSPDFGAHGLIDRFSQISPKILLAVDGYTYNSKGHDIIDRILEIQSQIPSLEKIIILPYLNEKPNISNINIGILYHEFTKNQATEITFKQLPFDHPIYILYSSGTTGVPKCIVHGSGGILLQHLKELVLHTDISEKDIFMYFTTCGWMMWNWLVSGLATGATLLLYDGSPFNPKRDVLFNLLEKEKVSVFGTSAKFISAAEKYNLHPINELPLINLRVILTTGSPLLPNSFEYVYSKVKKDVCLSSISGGTDIVSCFGLGNPILPVYKSELQSRGLGLKVEIYNEFGESVKNEKGELVCTAPFPAMPIYFWNDKDNEKYTDAYFKKISGVWSHGDHAKITEHNGMIIYGRSDTMLKPAGIRIGTAEIYRQVEKVDDVMESIVIGQNWNNDMRIVLFVKLKENLKLDEKLKDDIKSVIKKNASPHHVPAKIIQVADIPRTMSGKIMELAVKDTVHGKEIKNKDAIANPEALLLYKNLKELTY